MPFYYIRIIGLWLCLIGLWHFFSIGPTGFNPGNGIISRAEIYIALIASRESENGEWSFRKILETFSPTFFQPTYFHSACNAFDPPRDLARPRLAMRILSNFDLKRRARLLNADWVQIKIKFDSVFHQFPTLWRSVSTCISPLTIHPLSTLRSPRFNLLRDHPHAQAGARHP